MAANSESYSPIRVMMAPIRVTMLAFGGLLIFYGLEWHRNKVQTVLRGPRAWEAALVEGCWCKF